MSKDKQVQQDIQSKTRVNKPVQEEIKGIETAVANPIPSLQRAYTDPRTISPADAQTLQRTIGNQALGQLTIQRKMTLGPVGDKYEQEADAIAKQVVSKLHTNSTQNLSAETAQRQEEEEDLQMKPLVQRQEEDELQMKSVRRQEEDELQMKPQPSISSLQRQEEEELQMKPVQRQEEEELQAKGDPMLAGGELSNDVESSVQSAKSGGQSMSDNIRQPMENAFNADFSNVKVHTGSQSDNLNRSLSARAFTSGKDIFFRQGEYNPGNSEGQELIAHELTHVVQQNAGAVQRNVSSSSHTLQAKFVNAKVNWGGRTTFRAGQLPEGQEGRGPYGGYVPADDKTGNSVGRGSKILVDDVGNGRAIPGGPADEIYRPAINTNIKTDNRDIPDNKIGWVKQDKVTYPQDPTIANALKAKLSTILKAVPRYSRLLNTPETRNSLLKGAVRYEGGNNNWGSTQREMFARSLMLTESTVFPKIREGALFTGQMLHYWKNQLGPNVSITRLKLTESDLHEHGLGVVFTTFRKRGNRTSDMWQKFAGNANEFEVVLKPEDKSLERALIGSQEDSVANQINDEAGLTEDQKLTTIKMESTATHGSMIEKVDGESMAQKEKSLVGEYLTRTEDVSPAFYETMTFAFIAGIGDLHKENVMYGTDDNKPYLIDADNVIEHDQMEKQNFGEQSQSGFSEKNRDEANEHRDAMKDMDHTYDKSALFTKLIEDDDVRERIFNLIRASLAGKSARVVPIGTGTWASHVNIYKGEDAVARTARVNDCAREEYIVRANGRAAGAGLIGNCNVGAGGGNYDQAEERTQLRQDFNGGIIPFYNYDFDSGHVTHNGQRIYTGQTVEEAIDTMEEKFDDASITQLLDMYF